MPCVSVKTRTCAYNMLFIKLVYFFVMQHTFNNKIGGGGVRNMGKKRSDVSSYVWCLLFFLPLCLSLLGRGTRKWVWLGQFFIGSFTLLQRCWLLTWFAFIVKTKVVHRPVFHVSVNSGSYRFWWRFSTSIPRKCYTGVCIFFIMLFVSHCLRC